MKQLYFDLDGVLRDLCKSTLIDPTEWNCFIDGLNFTAYFTAHIDLLWKAPPTEYLTAINALELDVHILSTQPDTWKDITLSWVKKNIPRVKTVQFANNKISLLEQGDILVEDSPNLDDYSQVIVVDKPYNKHIPFSHVRVYSPIELIYNIYKFRSLP